MDAPLRVTMLIKHFPTRQGGAERLLEALLPLLAERGVETTVIARRHDDLAPYPVAADVVLVPVRGGRELSAAWYLGSAVRRIVAQRPDVIHAHSLLSPTTAALVAGRTLGIPTVATVHGGGVGGEVQRLRAPRRGGMPRLRLLARSLDRLVVISDEIDRELAEVGVPADRRVPIPNGVDARRFRPGDAADREALRARLGLGAGPIVVYAGRLIEAKGTTELLGAWRTVRGAVPDAQLVLLGDGADRARLESLAGPSDGVRFEGKVDEVDAYLRGADAFVLPSHAEGLSIALLEAMASGLAVVATDVGATADVLDGTGVVIPPRDQEALAAALVEVLGDPDRRAALAGAARRRVVDDFELADVADRLVMLYRTLAGRS